MNLRDPFGWIKKDSQKNVFKAFLIFTFIAIVVFQFIDLPLRTEISPLGIVSFELAGDLPAAREMVNSWGERGKLLAMFGLGFDYLFMFLYVITIGLGCVIVAQRLRPGRTFMISAGLFLAWAQIAAGLFDAVENYCLTSIVLGVVDGAWAEVAFFSASVKFLIITAGISYIIVGSLIVFHEKKQKNLRYSK